MFAFVKKVVAGVLTSRWRARSERKSAGQVPPPGQGKLKLESLEERLTPSATVTPPTLFTAGMTLTPNQSVLSPNGQIELILQGDGNLVEYNLANGKALFATNTAGTSANQAIMQGDGNFVLYDPSGNAVYATNTNGHAGAFLEIRDDGKVVVTKGNRPLFAAGKPVPFTLNVGDTFSSANGQNYLIMQGDGNLVEYNQAGTVLFATNTAGSGAVSASMQSDGNLVLYTMNGTPVFATNTDGNPGAFLDVLNDGHVNIYAKGKRIFSSTGNTSSSMSGS